MKKTLIITLSVILGVSLILLAAAFGLKTVTERNAQKEHVKLLEMLLPDGKDFQKVEYDGEDANIKSIHKADNGFVIETVTMGYADEITMYIGVNNDGAVTGLVVREAHETNGLGNQILTDHVFLSQFLNKSGTFTVGTVGEDAFSSATGTAGTGDNEISIDGISGATVSSKAVARSVNSAIGYLTGADVESSATEWGG
jgi:electron transport complex protein RnfG